MVKKAKEVVKSINEYMERGIGYCMSMDTLVDMSQNDLDMLKMTKGLIDEFNDYIVEDAEQSDKTIERIEKIERKLDSIDRKLDNIGSKLDKLLYKEK